MTAYEYTFVTKVEERQNIVCIIFKSALLGLQYFHKAVLKWKVLKWRVIAKHTYAFYLEFPLHMLCYTMLYVLNEHFMHLSMQPRNRLHLSYSCLHKTMKLKLIQILNLWNINPLLLREKRKKHDRKINNVNDKFLSHLSMRC